MKANIIPIPMKNPNQLRYMKGIASIYAKESFKAVEPLCIKTNCLVCRWAMIYIDINTNMIAVNIYGKNMEAAVYVIIFEFVKVKSNLCLTDTFCIIIAFFPGYEIAEAAIKLVFIKHFISS